MKNNVTAATLWENTKYNKDDFRRYVTVFVPNPAEDIMKVGHSATGKENPRDDLYFLEQTVKYPTTKKEDGRFLYRVYYDVNSTERIMVDKHIITYMDENVVYYKSNILNGWIKTIDRNKINTDTKKLDDFDFNDHIHGRHTIEYFWDTVSDNFYDSVEHLRKRLGDEMKVHRLNEFSCYMKYLSDKIYNLRDKISNTQHTLDVQTLLYNRALNSEEYKLCVEKGIIKEDQLAKIDKVKCVYRIYSVLSYIGVKELHIDNFPIIYSNSEVVYYTDNGKFLKTIETDKLINSISNINLRDCDDINVYFITSNESELMECFQSLKSEYNKLISERKYTMFAQQYNKCCTEINDYEKVYKDAIVNRNTLRETEEYKICIEKGYLDDAPDRY